jgi:hypothetical protein
MQKAFNTAIREALGWKLSKKGMTKFTEYIYIKTMIKFKGSRVSEEFN